jgi:hypothetical protein
VTRISAPTPYVWIIGRTKTDGPQDYDAVHKIRAGYKITPLSQWRKPAQPVEAKIDPTVDMRTPPKIQVAQLGPDQWVGDSIGIGYKQTKSNHHAPYAGLERRLAPGAVPGVAAGRIGRAKPRQGTASSSSTRVLLANYCRGRDFPLDSRRSQWLYANP